MKKTFLTILCVVYSLSTLSQGFDNKKIIKYSSRNGLSYGFVTGIVQDDNGFMWFATEDGLNRFDGINFKVFKHKTDDPYSLPGNFVEILFKDLQGDIWISSRRGIYQFNTNTEKFVKCEFGQNSALKNVNHICAGKNDIIWFASSSAGLFSYNKISNHIINYHGSQFPGLSQNIYYVFQDSKGLLWTFGTKVSAFEVSNGVNLKDVSSSFSIPLKTGAYVNTIFEDHYSNIWIATSKGLILFDRNHKTVRTFEGLEMKLKSNFFLSLIEDKNNLLIGLQDGGLYKLNLEKAVNSNFKKLIVDPVKTDNNTDLTERSVYPLYRDRDKNIWAGTYGDGVFLIGNVSEKFKKFQNKLVGSDDYLRYYGMCQDNQGNLWLGTDGDGIYKKKLNGDVIDHYFADGSNAQIKNLGILCAYKDHVGNLWFGSYANGLFKYDQQQKRFINFVHSANDAHSLCSDDVRAIFEDSQFNLWIGTNGGGISELKNGKKYFVNFSVNFSSLTSNNIRAFCEDKNANIYIGTIGSGLLSCKTKDHKFSNFFNQSQINNLLSSHAVYSLKCYDNRLLIGTEGNGIIIYDLITKKITKYTEMDGLANNTINSIQRDRLRNIWVSTNKGLSKIDQKGKIILNYDITNGLQTGHFSPGSSMYSEKDKFMCFGGTAGYNIFFPETIQRSTFKPKVIITGLQLFNKDVEVGHNDNILSRIINRSDRIVLNSNQSVFAIQYVALDYAYAEKCEFAYQLVGLDNSWNYVSTEKSATYRYLAPGDYIFKIKAANEDGVWSHDYTSIKIRILPPWYKTTLAYAFYLILGMAFIYLVVRYRITQARLKYDAKLAKMTSEKETELNEKKLSFFTNISHEFRTPLTLIINPVKELLSNKSHNTTDLNNIYIVYKNARRLLSLVDQLLLFQKADSEADKLKIVKLNIISVCKEVFLCFNHQASNKKIRFEFRSTTDFIDIFADREKLEIVLFNLISNALKFTPAHGEIICEILETEKDVCIEIKDSGIGIDKNIGENLFNKFYQVQNNSSLQGGFGIGLYLAKMFIEEHNGTISYDSVPGCGTTFNISLLKGKHHLGQNLIFEDITETSVFLDELIDDDSLNVADGATPARNEEQGDIFTNKKSMLIVEDNLEIRQYLKLIFDADFEVLEADNGNDGLDIAYKLLPDFIISDVMMNGLSGIELCSRIKEDGALNHIPIILLTASSSAEIKLKGIEGGADDYITKPFEKEVLIARVKSLLKNKNNLQKYFYSEITLKSNNLKVPADYKEFLDNCIKIVEQNLGNKDFCTKDLSIEIGMGHSNLYKKIKNLSGRSVNEFIRFIRLRKAAEMFISTDQGVAETAYIVGISDLKYFREQFCKLFGVNPSEYIKKFRKPFRDNLKNPR